MENVLLTNVTTSNSKVLQFYVKLFIHIFKILIHEKKSYRLQTVTGVKIETFKRKLDEWLRTIPDTPRIDDYGAGVVVSTNSLVDQGKHKCLCFPWSTKLLVDTPTLAP